jgi:hypothetical protein
MMEALTIACVINLVVACANFWTWLIAGSIIYRWVQEKREAAPPPNIESGVFRMAKKPDGTVKLQKVVTPEERETEEQMEDISAGAEMRAAMDQYFYGGVFRS